MSPSEREKLIDDAIEAVGGLVANREQFNRVSRVCIDKIWEHLGDVALLELNREIRQDQTADGAA